MTVVTVNEVDHGCIGVAVDYKAAVRMLFEDHWIGDLTEVWDEKSGNFVYISELSESLGEDWLDKMCDWSIEDFNDFWDGSFFMCEHQVYGG